MKPRLLLVDDDARIVHELHRILREDHELRYALDGLGALRLLRDWTPDLILLDEHMPGMKGAELIQQMRALRALARTAIVLMSARPAGDMASTTLEPGAQALVAKPIDAASLRSCIRAQWATGEPSRAAGVAQQSIAPSHGTADEPLDAESLAILHGPLLRCDLAALDQAERMDVALRAWMGPRQHADWRQNLDRLDFGQALALLDGLLKEESTTPDPGADRAT